MFTVALLIIAKKWEKLSVYQLIVINKRWNIPEKDYYSSIKWKGALIHITTWLNLENLCQVKEARWERPHTE